MPRDAELSGTMAGERAHAAVPSLVRVAVTGCRLTGISLFEAFVRDVTFAGCRIDLASFGSSRLQQVTFEDFGAIACPHRAARQADRAAGGIRR